MDCPPDMAASFLRKWRDENTVLTVEFSSRRFSVGMEGVITDFEEGVGLEIMGLAVKSPSGEVTAAPAKFLVNFEGAVFEYADSREASAEVRGELESLFVCFMII